MFNGPFPAKSLVDVSLPPADQLNVVTPTTPSPYPVGRIDSGKTLHNKAAAGTVTIQLPSDANIGDHFEVMEVSAHNVVIDPTSAGTSATGTITDGASTTTASSGAYTLSTQGASCEIVCIAAGPAWQVVRKQGTCSIT